ncbi:C-type lectin domain-containing protein [Chryseobacterium fluminis]|uniref:C-type lectin domain-containing protein n=1 Tax=Chryseobacterium fluminis TaxID=2983606 RepID=UPI00225591A5|nr:C-type lectin domain-containing protein [Chryseobacterium sp. MMS21-Ot14]UZT97948.1 C-type lectin domain-containing protein [Chryseobacterium sp. MMS21-Ot14]
MKKYLLAAVLLSAQFVSAQVGINTTAPRATLDVAPRNTDGTTAEGVIAPRLSGNQLSAADSKYTSAHAGVIIYATSAPSPLTNKTLNITAPGYYYFDGNIWHGMGAQNTTTTLSISSVIDPNILGYVPSNTATAGSDAPATLTVNGITAMRTGVLTFNGHSYAAYSASAAGITWYNAYNAAKNMGGYLATFTTDAEWQQVETALLSASAYDTQQAWIGFAKFSWFAGVALTPDPEEKWITGEQPLHDYSAGGTSAVRKSNWFNTGEPNNSGGTEGFVITLPKNSGTQTYGGYTSTHAWNDVVANTASTTGFIVEFQQ